MADRVLVPLDGSPLAERILPYVERLAGPADSEIVLLRVVEPPSSLDALASAGRVEPEALVARQLEAKHYLEDVRARLEARGLRVRTALRHGQAVPEILAAVSGERIQLVAMSTHGRSGLGRVLLGSVAEAVLREAGVPVLLARAPAAEPPA